MKFLSILERIFLIVVFFVFLVTGCFPGNTVETAVVDTPINVTSTPVFSAGIGVMGDSTSDEYRADDARGGEYGETTLNWVEQLVISRNLNFGEWGTWDGPRRTGYEYNWARTGATVKTMISSGQHTGLAQQVEEGKVSFVVLWIGGNDFHLKNGPYEKIYSGTLSGSALEEYLDDVVNGIELAIDTVLQAGDVKMAIVTITDQGMSPQAPAIFPDPLKRQRVTEVIESVNTRIIELASARSVIIIDSNELGRNMYNKVDSQDYLRVGDQRIFVLEQGDEPHHLQLGDNIGHSGTVLSGMIANLVFIEPFNEAFGLDIPTLTEEEILRNAGIR